MSDKSTKLDSAQLWVLGDATCTGSLRPLLSTSLAAVPLRPGPSAALVPRHVCCNRLNSHHS